MSVLRFVVQGVGLAATAESQGSYIILGPDHGHPIYTSMLCENAVDPSWDEVVVEGAVGEYDESTDVIVCIFEVNSEGTSMLVGTVQVSVSEMQAGAADTPARRFALVNDEGTETGHLAFLGASAGPAPVSPGMPGRPRGKSAGGDAASEDGRGSPASDDEEPSHPDLVPAAAVTYPTTGRLRPRSPTPPDAAGALDAGMAGASSDGGTASAAELAARLEALRAKTQELEATCRTADDANARAEREIKWRQTLLEEKGALQGRVEELVRQLGEEETARLQAVAGAEEARARAEAAERAAAGANSSRAEAERAAAAADRLRAEAESKQGPSPRTAAVEAQRLREAMDEARAAEERAAQAVREAADRQAEKQAAEVEAGDAKRLLAEAEREWARETAELRAQLAEAKQEALEAQGSAEEAATKVVTTARVVAEGFRAAAASLGLDAGSGGDGASGIPPAVLGGDWESWDASLVAAAVEAAAGAAVSASEAARAASATSPHDAAAASVAASDLRKELAQQVAEHAKAIEEKNKLIREWEHYANHWERRGREAERSLKQLETAAAQARQRAAAAEAHQADLTSQLQAARDELTAYRQRPDDPYTPTRAGAAPQRHAVSLSYGSPPTSVSPPRAVSPSSFAAAAAAAAAAPGHLQTARRMIGEEARSGAAAQGGIEAEGLAAFGDRAGHSPTGRRASAAARTTARLVPATPPAPPSGPPPLSAVRITQRGARVGFSGARRTPVAGQSGRGYSAT